jgi:hypothetical protein
MTDPAAAPVVRYWHLFTDAEGVSHQQQCALRDFALQSMQPPADPQWQGTRISAAMTTLVTVQPVGWFGNWHENPRPQWIVPLSGRWFVESMDGMRVEMGAGELSFGGDQHCRARDGRLGHRSGTVGAEPAVLLVIQLDALESPRAPCAFR